MVRRPSERLAKKSISGSRTKHTVSRYRHLKKVKDVLFGCGQGLVKAIVDGKLRALVSRSIEDCTRLTTPIYIVFGTHSCIISIAHTSNSYVRQGSVSFCTVRFLPMRRYRTICGSGDGHVSIGDSCPTRASVHAQLQRRATSHWIESYELRHLKLVYHQS